MLGSAVTEKMCSVGLGGASFLACGVSTQLLGLVLQVSTRSRLLPLPLTYGSVGVASLVAYRLASGARNAIDLPLTSRDLRAVVCGLAIFSALGGRGASFVPSNVLAVGAFGRRSASIPAKAVYATAAERLTIAGYGKTFGCHSCGRRKIAEFVADHQPPLKLARWRKNFSLMPGFAARYRFYPQCVQCSKRQAAILRTRIITQAKQSPLLLHPFKFRRYHATGFFVEPIADHIIDPILETFIYPAIAQFKKEYYHQQRR